MQGTIFRPSALSMCWWILFTHNGTWELGSHSRTPLLNPPYCAAREKITWKFPNRGRGVSTDQYADNAVQRLQRAQQDLAVPTRWQGFSASGSSVHNHSISGKPVKGFLFYFILIFVGLVL